MDTERGVLAGSVFTATFPRRVEMHREGSGGGNRLVRIAEDFELAGNVDGVEHEHRRLLADLTSDTFATTPPQPKSCDHVDNRITLQAAASKHLGNEWKMGFLSNDKLCQRKFDHAKVA